MCYYFVPRQRAAGDFFPTTDGSGLWHHCAHQGQTCTIPPGATRFRYGEDLQAFTLEGFVGNIDRNSIIITRQNPFEGEIIDCSDSGVGSDPMMNREKG